MKWGYSGYTKAETRKMVADVKAKEEMQEDIKTYTDEEIDEIIELETNYSSIEDFNK
jgi:hypothetical protein